MLAILAGHMMLLFTSSTPVKLLQSTETQKSCLEDKDGMNRDVSDNIKNIGYVSNFRNYAYSCALETFYSNLIAKIDELNIQKIMKRKNPYLYRAKAMQNAAEIVDSVLTAFVSSSEETIFGNCFFEPIAIAASNGNKC